MFSITIDPSRHWIPPEPLELDKFLGREFPDLDLFAYWHWQAQNWVVAEWLSRDNSRAAELMVLGKLPSFTRDQLREFRRKVFQPQTAFEMRQIAYLDELRRKAKWDTRSAELEEGKARIRRDLHPGRGNQSSVSLFVPCRDILVP